MDDTISRRDAIEALKICDNNEDGINCYKCPLRDERWDGAWENDETNCYRKLMRDSAELLSAEPDIVRCGDCKHYNAEERLCNDLMGFGRYWDENNYCSFAERRTDATD